MFTKEEIRQIEGHGLTVAQAEAQMGCFRTGFPYLAVSRAATAGDGIVRLDAGQTVRYRTLYRATQETRNIVKFVPASGAATRMFRDLFAYLSDGNMGGSVAEAVSQIDRFAFAGELLRSTGGSREPELLIEGIVGRLGFGVLPKGLVPFHQYAEGARTAVEEHFAEGAMYAAGTDRRVRIHLTVSPEHREGFERLAKKAIPYYEARYGVTYDISYSQQDPATDTLAAGPDNHPFRDGDGRLLFRPAGHGALIGNLDAVDADLIFIKNIDNVAPDRLKADTVAYKEAIGGLLFELQRQSFTRLKLLEGGADGHLDEIARFVETKLCRKLPAGFDCLPAHRRTVLLHDALNRPLRVCGMVLNEGEPGGGPFWAENPDGSESLQIAEASQIAPEQQGLMQAATHFNPVDLACGVRDYLGRKFDLTRYVDPLAGFISAKSQQGRPLRALELPGLWNGSMAHWNTVFVEVPVSTFTPVKTINDLLRPEHQP